MKKQLYGENALVLQLSYDNTNDSVQEIQALYRWFQKKRSDHDGILSVRPGLDCLVVEYDSAFDADRFLEEFSIQQEQRETDSPPQETMILPVCYEAEYARDILEVERLTRLSRDEIVTLHTSSIYDVWLVGFMPGFPYLGSLSAPLRIRRKVRPDLSVPAGSVAIAEEFTGIYPSDSPGGWHVIGRTPKKLVDFTKSPPWLFDYGMHIQIQPISAKEFLEFNS